MTVANEIILQPPGAIEIVSTTKYLLETRSFSDRNHKRQTEVLEVKLENSVTSFYTKPIFKPKKYELF